MNLAVWLDRQARAAPERPALFWGKDKVATYGQFAESCGRIANWLRANAVLPGDRVAVFMKNQKIDDLFTAFTLSSAILARDIPPISENINGFVKTSANSVTFIDNTTA